MVKIVTFCGSMRKDSYNKKLLAVAVKAAESLGAEVTNIDLKDYVFPLYDGDLEESDGIPEKVKEVKEFMKDADCFIIASPEYNSGMSGVLKNMIDWVSRPEEGEGRLAAFSGKYAIIMGASPGMLGGLRGLYHLRYVLENIEVTVLAGQVTLSQAHNAFDDEGNLTDEKKLERVKGLVGDLVELVGKVKG